MSSFYNQPFLANANFTRDLAGLSRGRIFKFSLKALYTLMQFRDSFFGTEVLAHFFLRVLISHFQSCLRGYALGGE